jgi:hypothetical protein
MIVGKEPIATSSGLPRWILPLVASLVLIVGAFFWRALTADTPAQATTKKRTPPKTDQQVAGSPAKQSPFPQPGEQAQAGTGTTGPSGPSSGSDGMRFPASGSAIADQQRPAGAVASGGIPAGGTAVKATGSGASTPAHDVQGCQPGFNLKVVVRDINGKFQPVPKEYPVSDPVIGHPSGNDLMAEAVPTCTPIPRGSEPMVQWFMKGPDGNWIDLPKRPGLATLGLGLPSDMSSSYKVQLLVKNRPLKEFQFDFRK